MLYRGAQYKGGNYLGTGIGYKKYIGGHNIKGGKGGNRFCMALLYGRAGRLRGVPVSGTKIRVGDMSRMRRARQAHCELRLRLAREAARWNSWE